MVLYGWILVQLLLVVVASHAPSAAGSSSVSRCHDDEREALLSFKKGFVIDYYDGYEYAKTESWNRSRECCEWDGVKCDYRTGHVVKLDLSGSGLNGSFPGSNNTLYLLRHLRFLSLASNYLSGQVPQEIGLLSHLTTLDLSLNFDPFGNINLKMPKFNTIIANLTHLKSVGFPGLKGSFPGSNNTLYLLHHLRHLSLADNPDLYEQVPPIIGYLSHLTTLDLSNYHGQLKMPDFPTIIANLTHLEYLDLSYVSIASNLPPILFTFSQLAYLSLSDCGLVGEFPSRNVNTTMLGQIYLSDNNLTGIIPGSIFTLPFLNYLYLDDNLFTGIAEFKFDNDSISRTSLTMFDAGSNRLQGQIPDAIFDLHNLQYLSLGSNNLTETIPLSKIHKLHNLNRLFLSYNNLSIIDDMGPDSTPSSWPSFYTISLSSCNLGHFPTFLKEQKNLVWLDLSHNHIHGVVPHWFLNVSTTSLIKLDLSHNSLSGGLEQLPWKNLKYIDIGYNLFHSVVPVPSPTTSILKASNNQFTGVLPPSLCDVHALMILDLTQNNLTGNIPDCFASIISRKLSTLDLSRNQLLGVIPIFLFQDCPNLLTLSLSGNKLKGPIPQTLNNCLQLKFLDLSSNKLTGEFPQFFKVLPALRVLIIGSNNLQGSLTGSNTTNTFPMLQILDISSNDLTGSLPRDLLMSMKAMVEVPMSNDYLYMDAAPIVVWYKGITRRLDAILETMVLIDVSKNRFQGPIPDAIGGLVSLRSLNLDHNNFSGHIPSSLGNLTLLESLDLSYNRLGGGIPGELVNLKWLEVFNVSENDLVGPVPTGKQFDTFVDKSYLGNPGLCGPLLTKKCGIPNDDSNQATSGGSTDESSGFYVWESGLMGCGCGILVGLAWGYLIFWKMTPHWAIRLILKIETLVMVHHRRKHQKNKR